MLNQTTFEQFFAGVLKTASLPGVDGWRCWWHGHAYLPCADVEIVRLDGRKVRIAFVRVSEDESYRADLIRAIQQERPT